jgi:hypothetical protein
VFVILVIAGTRLALCLAMHLVDQVVRHLPLSELVACYVVTLSLVLLLGSFIMEPTARTLAALILRESLLVAFFLAGLIMLCGQQKW